MHIPWRLEDLLIQTMHLHCVYIGADIYNASTIVYKLYLLAYTLHLHIKQTVYASKNINELTERQSTPWKLDDLLI
jgi:hypothetical protein